MSILTLKSVTKSYSASSVAINNISLSVEEGEFLALTGESGCGKTTLLRLITGLERPDRGTIELENSIVAGENKFVPPQQRPIGLVFQDYALFPHMTVLQNVLFGLQSWPKTKAEKRSKEVLDLVNLPGLESRYPHQLSGGQQQRVAIARSLAPKPKLLLLDEPFSNLDTLLKDQVRQELMAILRSAGTTVILVTHDVQDALSMADTIAVLKEGELLQVGTPNILYHQPVDVYTASFFGKINLIPVSGNLGKWIGELEAFEEQSSITSAYYCLRPQHVKINNDKGNSFPAEVCGINFMGGHQQIKIKAADCDIWCQAEIHNDYFIGQQVNVAFELHQVHTLKSNV